MEKIDTQPAGTHVKELLVQNKMGIHARPAAMIVRVTNKYKAEVFVEKDEEQVNGKSIMGLMMLAAGHGSIIAVTAEGPDSEAAIEAVGDLIARKFEED
jgi:phosphocarrier protein